MPRPVGTMGETKFKILSIIYLNELRGTTTYGYDIWRILKERFHIYLDHGNLRNVYRHLKDLERFGLINRGKPQTVEAAPKRQTYFLTNKGREMKERFARYVDILERQAGNLKKERAQIC